MALSESTAVISIADSDKNGDGDGDPGEDDEDDDDGSISSELEEDGDSYGDQKFMCRSIHQLWQYDILWTELQSLPGATELIELIQCGDKTDKILTHPNRTSTGLLLATWMNEKLILRQLLEQGENPNATDNQGRTALHLAAYQGYAECVNLLLNYGANINQWDTTTQTAVTPLHCAANCGRLPVVRTLLKSGADVNAGLTTRSPLHYAVQSNATECVKELLEYGACPNTPQVFTETPLHVAASMGFTECISLLLKYGADVRVQFGTEKTTALHLAAEDGNVETVQLLLNAGADVNTTNCKMQTPLHLASLAQSIETLEVLLKNGADPNANDVDGRTPLHSAIVKVSRSSECVRLLLQAGANVNKPDQFGYTPLHIAALNEFSQCVLMLINYGGDVTSRTNGGVSALNFIIRRTPDVIPKYVSKLDHSIKLIDHEIGDVDCELKIDFHILVPSVGRGETDLLLNFIQVGQRDILKHPLCETFLYLKWERIRKFFLLSLFYHTVFVILFTAYVIGVYLKDCPHYQLYSALDLCMVNWHIKLIGYVLLLFNCLFLMKEVFQIAHDWRSYIRQWDNWLQWTIIIGVFMCVTPSSDIKSDVATWQHHVTALGILLTWLELMMIVGRFPMFGLYVQMFTTVAINFSKFLLGYSCLLIAFGLSFGVLFANYKSFHNLLVGLLKTVIMMSGELEFEDIFYDESAVILYPGTAHIIFLTFVLLVTVILTNLMVGLAVSDIQGLQQSAGLDRLVRQTELIAHLESMLFSQLLYCIPKKFLTFFYKSALLLNSQYHWTLCIRPNDPRETKIPKELIKNIYNLIAARKCKYKKCRNSSSKKKRNRARNVSSLSINKSEPEPEPEPGPERDCYRSRMHSSSSYNNYENLSYLKIKVEQLASELNQHHMTIQQKLNNLAGKLNN